MSSEQIDGRPVVAFNFKNMTGYEDGMVCRTMSEILNHGLWTRDSYSRLILLVLMIQIVSVVFVTRIVDFAFKPLGQPKFISDVIGGMIVGPSVLGRSKTFSQLMFPSDEKDFMVSVVSHLGIMYFIFLVGVKTDRNLLIKPSKSALGIGLLCWLIPYVVIVFTGSLLHSFIGGLGNGHLLLFLSASLSITYFPSVGHALEELDLLTSELGRISMSCSIINDAVGWCFMVLFIVLRQTSILGSFRAFILVMAFIVFTVYVVRPCILWIIEKTPEGRPVKQVYIIAILVGVLIYGLLSEMLGGAVTDGPLVLGLIIPEGSIISAALVEKTESFNTNILLPLFYMQYGLATDVFKIQDFKLLIGLQAILMVAYLSKFVGTILPSLHFNLSFLDANYLGLIMNIKGLPEMIIFIYWKRIGILDDEAFTILALTHLIETSIVAQFMRVLHRHPSYIRTNTTKSGIRSAKFSPDFRLLPCVHNEENVQAMISILDISNPTQESPINAFVLHLVELVGRAAALIIDQSAQMWEPNCDRIISAFKNYADNSDGRVFFHPFMVTAPYKTMHEDICRIAHEKEIALIIMPFHKHYPVLGGTGVGLSHLNRNVLANAPSSVGILVDRGFRRIGVRGYFSYNILLTFLGGEDDREALIFGCRVSGHPGVRCTVIRFLPLLNYDGHNWKETQLDDATVLEYKSISTNNERVVYREEAVEGLEQVFSVIRSLNGDYNLAVVGRRRGPNMNLQKCIVDWSDNEEELGVVGDFLASTDFAGSTVSVLVLQACSSEINRS